MSRVLIVCGSARRGGVTEEMCRSCAGALSAAGHEATVILPSELDIHHCTDCGGCRDGICTIDDGMIGIYEMFGESDILVMASPIHFSGPSSLIKTFMDRFQTFWYHPELPHPSFAAALLCGGSPEPRFEYTVAIMRAFAITTGMRWAGQLCMPDTDRRGAEGVDGAVSSFIEGILPDCTVRS